MRAFIALLSAVALFLAVSPARADDCCRVVVEGCSKKWQACLPGDCNNSREDEARDLVRKASKCDTANVSSYIHSCENEKCDFDLRKK